MSATAVANRTIPGPTTMPYAETEDPYADDRFSPSSTNIDTFSNYTVNTEGFTPLSRLSRYGFKIKSSSTFPSILNLYDEPISEESGKKEKKKKKHNRNSDFQRKLSKGLALDGMVESKVKTENRAIRIEAVAREQMERYEIYIKKLQEKVEKQRNDRRLRDEEFADRIKARQEEERLRNSIQKRPKQEYISDVKYLKKLPKSKFRKVVRLSDNLQKKGVLKNQDDIDRFWNDFGGNGLTEDIFNKERLKEEQNIEDWSHVEKSPRRKSKHKKRKSKIRVKNIDNDESLALDEENHGSDVENVEDLQGNESEISSPDRKHKERRHSKSRRKSNNVPTEKQKDKSEKNRKKAKSWPDKDPSQPLEEGEKTANEV